MKKNEKIKLYEVAKTALSKEDNRIWNRIRSYEKKIGKPINPWTQTDGKIKELIDEVRMIRKGEENLQGILLPINQRAFDLRKKKIYLPKLKTQNKIQLYILIKRALGYSERRIKGVIQTLEAKGLAFWSTVPNFKKKLIEINRADKDFQKLLLPIIKNTGV